MSYSKTGGTQLWEEKHQVLSEICSMDKYFTCFTEKRRHFLLTSEMCYCRALKSAWNTLLQQYTWLQTSGISEGGSNNGYLLPGGRRQLLAVCITNNKLQALLWLRIYGCILLLLYFSVHHLAFYEREVVKQYKILCSQYFMPNLWNDTMTFNTRQYDKWQSTTLFAVFNASGRYSYSLLLARFLVKDYSYSEGNL